MQINTNGARPWGITTAGGTNLDAAVRAFSDDKDVNKIVFTDGYGSMPRSDLKRT